MELKSEQQAFLAECEHDFADRYTLEDEEFKAIFDSEIPSPPVMSNWYPRHKRNQGGRGGRYRDFADRRHNNRPDYGRSFDRSERSSHEDNYRDREDRRWGNQDRSDYRSRDRSRYND